MKTVRAAAVAALLLLPMSAFSATFTVTNTNDGGAGSLRQAILDANAAPGDDTVAFNIASLSKTISILSTLPPVAWGTTVDGTTQPGYSGKPVVEVDGTNVPGTYDSVCIKNSGWVRGLVVNRCAGIGIIATHGSLTSDNFIGLDVTGTVARPNSIGVRVDAYTNASTVITRNVISGNGYGISNSNTGDSATIHANWIGTNGTGTGVVSNSTGIVVNYTSAPGSITDNYIVGSYWGGGPQSGYYGIELFYASNAVVTGNRIGILPSGQAAPGLIVGLHVYQSSFDTITGNTITGNMYYGIHVDGNAIRNLIRQNSIYGNGFGIRTGDTQYGSPFPTPNDSGDADSGPNARLNYPVLTSAQVSAGATVVTGTYNSAANQTYTLDFYNTPSCNATGYGEGKDYAGSTTVTTDGSGNASFTVSLGAFPSGSVITATAIDALSNSSEFSACAVVQGAGQLRFSSATAAAGEGAGSVSLTVTRTGGTIGAVSVSYATANGTATAADFTAASGTLNFAHGESSKTFSVPITQDTLFEGSEKFTVALSNPTGGASLGSPSTVTVTINDDDPPPTISIDDPSVTEGNSGTTNMLFTLTLSAPSPATTTVQYYTSSGSAYAGDDYQYATGTLTFAAGETQKAISVNIVGDTIFENDEVFYVYLCCANNATILRSTGTGKIINDDPRPAITVTDASVVEGNAGQSLAVVKFTASTPIYGSLYYFTTDGSAKNGKDYQNVSGSVYFYGETTKTVSIPVIGDTETESNEKFALLVYGNTTNATLDHNPASITILNDDAGFGPKDLSVPLGSPALFELDLGIPPAAPVEVTFASTNTTVLDPQSVTVTQAATTISVPTLAIGGTTVTVTVAAPYSKTFTSTVRVYEPATLVLTPQSLTIPEGGTLTVSASLQPAASFNSTVQLEVLDNSIAEVPSSIVIEAGKSTTFTIKALKKGGTALMTTLSASHGGQQSAFLLDVVAAPKTPVLTQVVPANGPVAGGTSVTVHGANLAADCTLLFGGVPAVNVAFVSASSMTATTPPHPAGTVDVLLSCGADTHALADAFTYFGVSPTVSGVIPSFGSTGGGTLVRITGTNFRSGCWPFFGSDAAKAATFISATEIIGETPPHAAGKVTVAIRCTDANDGTLANGFTYSPADDPAPLINSVAPLAGSPGESVVITGARFRRSDSVKFDAAAATILSSSPDTDVVRIPELPAGEVAITLTDIAGRSTTTGPIFTVLEPQPPRITSATPATVRAGTDVVLEGSGFRPGYSFALGTARATLVSLTYTRVLLRAPDIAAGTYPINVLNAAGKIASIGPSITVGAMGPSISNIAPACATTDGGGTMTIRGGGFEKGAVVTFDGIIAKTTVVDANTLSITIPAGAVGSPRIVITNPGGAIAALGGAFFYYSPFDPAGGCSGGRSRPARR